MRRVGSIVAVAALSAGAVMTAQPATAFSPGLSFGSGDLSSWQANGVVYAAGQAKGRVFVGGTFSQLRPPTGGTASAVSQSAFAALDAETGVVDTTCAPTLLLTGGTPTVRAVVASPDGSTIYLAGNFTSVNGTAASRVAAIDSTSCAVKTAFKAPSISSTVYGLAVNGSSLYLGGAFVTVGTSTRTKFAALNATTGALLPFVANAGTTDRATGVTANGRALALSPDGTKIALGGDFDTINGQDSHALAIVDATTGSNVSTYPAPYIHRDSVVKSLVSDSTTLYGGDEGTGGGVFDGRFALDWSSMTEKWRDTCLGATQAVLPYKGLLYSASHAHDCSSMNEFQDGIRNYFNAEPINDPTLIGWHPLGNDGIGEGIGPRALVVATGKTTGKDFLWAVGEFTKINGHDQQSLTRFGTTDNGLPPTPTLSAEALTSGAIHVRLRTVVDGDDSDLTYRIYRNGSTTPIWTGSAKSLWWTRPQITFVDSTATPGTTYTYRATVDDGTNVSALSASVSAKAVTKATDYPTAVINDGASLYWRYDETSGTWIQDRSGATTTGVNGLAVNTSSSSYGAPGVLSDSKAMVFSGSDNYVWDDQLVRGPQTYSIETWIKTGTTTGGKIIGFGSGRPRTDSGATALSGQYDRQVYMEDGGRLEFGAYSGGTQTVRSTKSYNDNQWHHIVATQGAGGMALWVDGVRVGKNSVSSAQDYLGVWHVGGDSLGYWPNQPTSNFFAGTIDETAIYPTVLSGTQVANHYALGGGTPPASTVPTDAYGKAVYNATPNLYWRLDEASGATTATDLSPDGNNPGTIGASVAMGQPGQVNGGKAAGLVGQDDSAVVSQNRTSSPGSFSTEAWFKTSTQQGGKIVGFENAPSGNGGSYDKHTYMTNDGRIIFGTYSGGTNIVSSPSGTAYNDNRWHHVVSMQDSTGMKLYLDGALVDSNSVTTNENSDGYWRIGAGNLGGWPSSPSSFGFSGSIDEVAVYGSALSASAVAAHYSLGQ